MLCQAYSRPRAHSIWFLDALSTLLKPTSLFCEQWVYSFIRYGVSGYAVSPNLKIGTLLKPSNLNQLVQNILLLTINFFSHLTLPFVIELSVIKLSSCQVIKLLGVTRITFNLFRYMLWYLCPNSNSSFSCCSTITSFP